MGPPEAAPARLGRYELLARLATGGMGEIFLARLEGAAGFEKLFVIKRILPHLAGDARFRGMLIAEARIASMMTHANVCQVYELGETDGQLYIVMEYLEGTTMLPVLRKLSKSAMALDLGFVAGVVQQVSDGLHYAHELKDRSGENLGVVHRDITPSNVFVTDAGAVKVLDFGIAKVKNDSGHTQTGTVKGKYAYMAPEQLRGAAVDRRADVFALGVVVYEMLALRRLFQRKTDYLTFRAVMEQPINDIRHYRTDCPAPLAAALTRALERDPAGRFDTARQFGSAVLDATSPHGRPWTQGEISDFLAAHFADEIRERTAQITRAVHAGADRRQMPHILQSDDETIEVEDASPDFPPVDSEVSETPVDIRHLRGPSDEHTAVADPQGRRPGSNPVTNATSQQLEALRPAIGPGATAPQPSIVVMPRRSVLWPVVAFAMVAVAGAALFLVWRQMENQPTRLVLSSDSPIRSAGGDANVLIVGDRVEADARTDDARPEPAARRPTPAEPPRDTARVPRDDPYRKVVLEKQSQATRCASRHGAPPEGSEVVIVIAPDGRPRRVTIEPASVDDTAVGGCIKNLFKAATFPTGDGDRELRVKLKSPA